MSERMPSKPDNRHFRDCPNRTCRGRAKIDANDPDADIAQRWSSSENSWKWIDRHGKGFGIGRPYLIKIRRMSGRSTAGNMPINAAGQMRNLRNWNRKGATGQL